MPNKQKAWLVIWDWGGPHAGVEDRLAAILRPRLARDVVREIVECLYAIHTFMPTELALWSRRPMDNPYKAKWDHHEVCRCGHNPYLIAQYVHDLVIQSDAETGLETISFVLPPIHELE